MPAVLLILGMFFLDIDKTLGDGLLSLDLHLNVVIYDTQFGKANFKYYVKATRANVAKYMVKLEM